MNAAKQGVHTLLLPWPLLRGFASKNPFLKVCLGAAGLPVGAERLVGACLPKPSVTAAVLSSPSWMPAVPMMLSANCTAYIWSARLLRGGGASACSTDRVGLVCSQQQHGCCSCCNRHVVCVPEETEGPFSANYRSSHHHQNIQNFPFCADAICFGSLLLLLWVQCTLINQRCAY